MIKQIAFFIVAIVCLGIVKIHAQEEALPIKLENASFEGLPMAGTDALRGWIDCGFVGESAPDIHPIPSGGHFMVTKAAYEGKTYLGMVVRDNDTWEAISQFLRQPLKGGKCYRFRVHIARSPMYSSLSRKTNDVANYTTPATLRVWGGDKPCGKVQLLHATKAIINTRWIEYEMEFRPKQDMRYVVFEAFYRTPVLFPYNGNILIDNATDIVPVPCDETVEEEILVEEEIEGYEDLVVINMPDELASTSTTTAPKAIPVPSTPVSPARTTPNSKAIAQAAVEEKATPPQQQSDEPASQKIPPKPVTNESGLASLDVNSLRTGSIIRVKKLYFEADKTDVREESDVILEEMYDFLNKNSRVIVEIGGHTNGTPPHSYCDTLSTSRAKNVAEYLTDKGIAEERVQYKGYGKRKPVASNRTAEGRRRNQRVEMKVLGFMGEKGNG
ncbi:MAG: OmpA family protein [Bacteroidota bacterium]